MRIRRMSMILFNNVFFCWWIVGHGHNINPFDVWQQNNVIIYKIAWKIYFWIPFLSLQSNKIGVKIIISLIKLFQLITYEICFNVDLSNIQKTLDTWSIFTWQNSENMTIKHKYYIQEKYKVTGQTCYYCTQICKMVQY